MLENFFEKLQNLSLFKETQTVYRYLSKEEMYNMWGMKTNLLGFEWSKNDSDAHDYDEGVRYLHFFKNREDSSVVFSNIKHDKDFLATFEIEKSLLRETKASVPYAIGYDECNITEYAIPADQFKLEWFRSYEPIDNFGNVIDQTQTSMEK